MAEERPIFEVPLGHQHLTWCSPVFPILFRVDVDSPYLIIVAGERRFKAAQQVGLSTVPGICVEASPPAEAGGWGAGKQIIKA